MVRLHHFLSIVVHFPFDLPGVEGSLFLPGFPALQLGEPAAKAILEETHVTNRRDGSSRFYQTLGLVKRLVEEREVMVEVPETELHSLLDQIDILRDQVTGMLPSGSVNSLSANQPLSTDQPESQSLSISTGQSSQESQAPSSTVLGGAFIESAAKVSQESSGESESTGSTQDSTEETEELESEELESEESESEESESEESKSTNSTQDPTEQTEEGSQGSPEESGTTSSALDFPAQTEEKLQALSGDPNPPSSTQESIEQTEYFSADIAHCKVERQVSGLNPLRRDYNCATETSAATDVLIQSSSVMTSPSLSDGVNQDIQSPTTAVAVEGSLQTTTAVTLSAPLNVVHAAGSVSGEQPAFEKIQELSTTVLTSTNTRESTVTMTTTRTKFLYFPLPSVETPLGAGLATNTTATPNSNSEDTSETPSMRMPVVRVPDSNTTAEGAPLSGFKTLSKPTTSVGEGTF
ncbi:hypothetical protein G7Z17_g9188 [Cylindrodendrum hubeiense]|uniref:Uncharacterized protein n=1 Tax=Cylindrodendrum hubeiense TaxID=595255 RepID=A0A9P5LCH1_9HYPO|nr:hypothetical protein G7Z17_g9188 [Cylindrodendrum hubeiense]